jgi:hypothetical protein
MVKRSKSTVPAQAPVAEVSSGDRAALVEAFKSGLIVSWKRDTERGYRLTRVGGVDEYVEVANLAKHLARLGTTH